MCKLYRIWLKPCWMLRKRQCMRDGERIGGRQRSLSSLSFFLAPWETTARREDKFVFDTVWIRSRGDGIRFSITSGSLIQTVLPGVCDLTYEIFQAIWKRRFNLLFYLFIFNRIKAIKFKIPGLACYNLWAMGNPSEIVEKYNFI